MYGDYLQLQAEGSEPDHLHSSLHVRSARVRTHRLERYDDPGLLMKELGKGQLAWLPWNIGGLYYRHSSEAHSKLLSDLVDIMLPQGRQLKSNAHPLVEITFMRQNNRRLIHFINLSGHADTPTSIRPHERHPGKRERRLSFRPRAQIRSNDRDQEQRRVLSVHFARARGIRITGHGMRLD